ncbi:MAG: ABC transporter permease, partial [Gammaproteobacteria bacterium]|nr:ABC transporter permease [Gammaproteobacteria bacterium]
MPAAGLTIKNATVYCTGSWTGTDLHDMEKTLSQTAWPRQPVSIDLSGLDELDTPGAWLLHRTIDELRASGLQVSVDGAGQQESDLLQLVAANAAAAARPPRPAEQAFLENIGQHAISQLGEYRQFLEFVGRLSGVVWQAVVRPWKIRFSLVVRELQEVGVNAMPIVGLLSFLVGVVIAYQGGIVLRDYGANIYIADIVGLSTVRELAPLITAIIVAGRTGSAYTAQIGTMMVTEEVDALRSIGIAPIEMLVLPKVIALVIALPLLTVFADVMGLLGGLIMSASMLDLNPVTYLGRLEDALTLRSFLSGIGKAPV